MLALSMAELQILDWIAENCRTAWLDVVFPVITSMANDGIIWIALTLVLLAIKSQREYGAQAAIALIIGFVLCNCVLKTAVDRIRPFELANITELLVRPPTDASFPSGHSTASFAMSTVLLLNRHPLRWPVLILSVLIALSRLYLYVHYPTDVLAGVLLGILNGVLAVTLWRKVIRPRLLSRKKAKTAP